MRFLRPWSALICTGLATMVYIPMTPLSFKPFVNTTWNSAIPTIHFNRLSSILSKVPPPSMTVNASTLTEVSVIFYNFQLHDYPCPSTDCGPLCIMPCTQYIGIFIICGYDISEVIDLRSKGYVVKIINERYLRLAMNSRSKSGIYIYEYHITSYHVDVRN